MHLNMVTSGERNMDEFFSLCFSVISKFLTMNMYYFCNQRKDSTC